VGGKRGGEVGWPEEQVDHWGGRKLVAKLVGGKKFTRLSKKNRTEIGKVGEPNGARIVHPG